MTDQNRTLDPQLIQRSAQQASLDFDSYIAAVIWTIAVAVTRPIKSHRLITRSQRRIESPPILARSGIAMNQNDGAAGAFDYEVKIRAFDVYKFRSCLREIVSNAGRKIRLFESAGDFHNDLCAQEPR